MRFPFHSTLFVILLSVLTVSAALAQPAQKQGTGVITGRVMLKDKGMANVAVILYPSDFTPNRAAVARATTDVEGNYKLAGVPAGRYNVVAVAPAMVGTSGGMYGESGKTVTLADGETVEKIDFALVKGGVITGRVTDADGAPVIGEHLHLSSTDKSQRGNDSYSYFNPFMYETDDRGVYRLYGLPAGRYTINIGQSPDSGEVGFGSGGQGYYARTFYPSVTNEPQATIIEVTEGSEASNIDITLGRKSQSFVATGRIVDESGQPVPNIGIAHGVMMRGENRVGGYGSGGSMSDARGRFRVDRLTPGRYAVFSINSAGQSDGYTDPAVFEITDADVSGLELKFHRGASINGVVVVEGASDQSVHAKFPQLSLGASVVSENGTPVAPRYSNAKIAADGSFNITGVPPGKARFYLAAYPQVVGLTIARIERDGVPQREIEVAPGAQVTGVRVVLEYGTGSVRGLVKFENGLLPEGVQMNVFTRRLSDTTGDTAYSAQVDSRGRFLIEGLAAGDYEITLQPYVTTGTPRRLPPVKQNVTVTNGVESEVTLTLDLSVKPKEGGNNE